MIFSGGGSYEIRIGDTPFDRTKIKFDTSKLTFICLGALTNLREQKTTIERKIGFGENVRQEQIQDYTITPEDLIYKVGLERELVGRLSVYLHTNYYTIEDLKNILKNSTISPFIGLKDLVEKNGKKLQFEEEIYQIIAEAAYELNTGARGLQTIVNNIRTQYLKEILRGKSDVIYLDANDVIKIIEGTASRRGRG